MKNIFALKPAVFPLLRENDTPALREAYNRIRTALRPRLGDSRTVGVVSSGSGEGSAACCENLALSFARLGLRVLLVDADLRAEAAPALFGEGAGLADALCGADVAVSPTGDSGLFTLSRGDLTRGNPTDLLGGACFAKTLAKLAGDFDLVLVSLPAVNDYADAAAAAAGLDGYAVLVTAGHSGRAATATALEQLRDTGRKLFGFITAE